MVPRLRPVQQAPLMFGDPIVHGIQAVHQPSPVHNHDQSRWMDMNCIWILDLKLI